MKIYQTLSRRNLATLFTLFVLSVSFSCASGTSNITSKDIRLALKEQHFVSDKLLTVKKVTTTSEQKEFEASKMIDGDKKTFFNSRYGEITKWPFIISFEFSGNENLDYLIHNSRQDNGNGWGVIGKFELWAATAEAPELSKIGEYDFKGRPYSSSVIPFDKALNNVTKMEFRINSAYMNRVSCAEMEFYTTQKQTVDLGDIFADKSCSALKKNIKKKDIEKIDNLPIKMLATALYDGSYDSDFRVQEYRPYQHPNIMAALNRTNTYSLRDNATGMYVDNTDENLVLFVGDNQAESLSLEICNFKPTIHSASYPLKPGLNVIKPDQTGLIYIYNHTDENIPLHPKDKSLLKDKTVKVHFLSGTVNGYFDRTKHDNAFWQEILKGEKYGIAEDIDIVGNYAHVVWSLSDYRKFNTDIVKQIEYFDNAIYGQMDFMGLVKYDRMFNNRSFIHVNYDIRPGVGAYATDYRTAYNFNGYANVFCTEEFFKKRIWVIGHEVGHTNQVRPGMRWAGTVEITNNLCALYNQEQVLDRAIRIDEEYPQAVQKFVKGKMVWSERDNPKNIYDNVFLKLVPMWQLKLYFIDILGQKDFYKDIYEHCRTKDYTEFVKSKENFDGLLQLDFMRQSCIIGQRNMLDFFEDWGMLRPTNFSSPDYYGKTEIIITQKQIDELKKEIEAYNFKKPNIGIPLYELTDANCSNYVGKEK